MVNPEDHEDPYETHIEDLKRKIREFERQVKKDGLVLRDPKGKPIPHPLLPEIRAYKALLQRALKDFS